MASDTDIKRVDVTDEFRACEACGYERGFHISLGRRDGKDALRIILICPNCGARYDIQKAL